MIYVALQLYVLHVVHCRVLRCTRFTAHRCLRFARLPIVCALPVMDVESDRNTFYI